MTWTEASRPEKLTVYTVFHEESDFQVKNEQIRRPEGKNKEKHVLNRFFLFFLFFYLFFLKYSTTRHHGDD